MVTSNPARIRHKTGSDPALIGCGPMAIAHASAFAANGITPIVIGRSPATATAFSEATGLPAVTGGVKQWLRKNPAPASAVVAVGVRDLASTSILLMKAGTRRLLIEKPAALDLKQLRTVSQTAEECAATVYIGYNRRFYPSTIAAANAITEDGGTSSVSLVFTERARLIGTLNKHPDVASRWFLANSTHVWDLAFHLGGVPRELSVWRLGGLDWHPSGSRFGGAGVTPDGALFTFRADWDGPGGWGVEVITRERRLVLRPLETLSVQTHDSFALADCSLPIEPAGLKPGLFGQLRAFLFDECKESLLSLTDHQKHIEQVLWPVAYGHQTTSTVTSLRVEI